MDELNYEDDPAAEMKIGYSEEDLSGFQIVDENGVDGEGDGGGEEYVMTLPLPIPTNLAAEISSSFAHAEIFLTSLSEANLDRFYSAAISTPLESWLVEIEHAPNDIRILLDEPIFYANRNDARQVAMNVSQQHPALDVRLMKWKHGRKLETQMQTTSNPAHAAYRPSSPQQRETIAARREKIRELLMVPHTAKEVASMIGMSEQTVRNLKRDLESKGVRFPDPYSHQVRKMGRPLGAVAKVIVSPEIIAPAAAAAREPMPIPAAIPPALPPATQTSSSISRKLTMEQSEVVTSGNSSNSASFSTAPFPHLLIEGLIGKMPPVGSQWTSNNRLRWMDTMIKVIDLLWEDPEQEDWFYSVNRDNMK